MKSASNSKESMKLSANTESRTVLNASHKASVDTSLPYRLTPSKIELLRQSAKEADKELDILFVHIKPFKK